MLETKIRDLISKDRDPIARLLEKTPQFNPEEKRCALELVDLYINEGDRSGYDFFVSEDMDCNLLGYVCFGRIPLTDNCFDIYWLVVDPNYHRNGIGTQLLNAVTEKIRSLGARKLFVETSSREDYLPAQDFYEKLDFRPVSRIKDFYRIGDDKLVYVKDLGRIRI